jgi:hypothetical protein
VVTGWQYTLGMAVAVEMHNTGDSELQRDVVVMVEHVLSDRPGNWRVSIIGLVCEQCRARTPKGRAFSFG